MAKQKYDMFDPRLGWENRKLTHYKSYEFKERIINIGDVINEEIIITDIVKVEWITRIKPTEKCSTVIKFLALVTGLECESETSIFRKRYLR